MKRRTFVKAGAAAVPLFDIVPSHVLGLNGQTPPSDIVQLGHIGIGGRGRGFLRPEAEIGKPIQAPPNLGGYTGRNQTAARSAALCDVDPKRLDEAATRVGGKTKTYR